MLSMHEKEKIPIAIYQQFNIYGNTAQEVSKGPGYLHKLFLILLSDAPQYLWAQILSYIIR